METFSAWLVIWEGNSPVPGEFPAQRPVTRGFDVFFDLRLNKRLSNQSWGWWFETLLRPLWRHYYDKIQEYLHGANNVVLQGISRSIHVLKILVRNRHIVYFITEINTIHSSSARFVINLVATHESHGVSTHRQSNYFTPAWRVKPWKLQNSALLSICKVREIDH